MSECGSTCSASTTSLTKDLTKSLKMGEIELKILLEEFRNASNEEGLLEKENFFDVIKNTLSQKFDIQNSMPAFHRIYEAFDLDGNGAIDFVELATGLSTLLYGEEKDILRFVFGLIDVNGDGSVQQEEMIDFFRKFFIGQAEMNGYKLTSQRWKTLEDYLSRTFTSTDLDQNGTIEFDEFVQAVDDPDSPLGMLFLYFHSTHSAHH
uniref:Differentiation-specific calcium binding protein 1 n=1 Tax=Naegleria gruberi TaxID=5762 RepID=Q6QNG1_NAEGR|nr:differentiation-specific calcium binding protein 1 [Naegleria gruberi]